MLYLGSDRYTLWRNDHYIVDLDEILKISKEQDRRISHGSAVKLWPDFSEVIHWNQPVLCSTAPWSSISKRAKTLEASPNSVMSWTPPGSLKRPEIGAQLTSPTALSQASSPTSLTPNTPTTSAVSCRACSKDFTGSPQDARSNLQRHLRTSKRHNTNAGLKCPLPECRVRASMRSDNLGPHLKSIHKILSSSKRQIIINESRLLARRVDSDGIARRMSRLE